MRKDRTRENLTYLAVRSYVLLTNCCFPSPHIPIIIVEMHVLPRRYLPRYVLQYVCASPESAEAMLSVPLEEGESKAGDGGEGGGDTAGRPRWEKQSIDSLLREFRTFDEKAATPLAKL